MEEKKRKRLYLTMDEWRISPHFIDLGHVEDHETIELILVTSDDLSGMVTAEFALGKTRALAPQVSVSDGAIVILFTAAMLSEPGLGSLQIVEHYPDGAIWHSSILQYRVRDSIKANATVPEEQLTAFDRALSSYAKQMSLVTETNQTAKDALEKATEAETSVKSLTAATEAMDGLMSKEDKTKLDALQGPLIVYATKQEKAATDVFDRYTLDHPAKEIYEAAASGREVRVYVKRSAVSQSVTDGISASYVLSSFTLFKKEPVKYTVFFKASSSDSLGGDEQYEDQNEKVYVKGNKVTMLYLSMQPADGTLAISSTWSAYDGRPALDLVKTHIRSELSAVSDRVTKLEAGSSGNTKLVLTATATGKSNTAGAALYSLGKTRSEVYQAVQDGTDVEVRFHDTSQNVDVILRPAYIGPSSNGLHQIAFSGVYAFGASQVTAIYYYALQYDMVDEDNFILLSRRTD